MKNLGKNGTRLLKGAHLVAACCWVGGCVALFMLYFLKSGVSDAGTLYGINRSIHHVDMLVVVIPGALGCLVTGLLYSIFTGWGFFRHGWLVFKWVVTIFAILFGTFFLGPWGEEMMELSGTLGMAALADGEYLHAEKMNFVFGTLQALLLVATVFVSVYKPGKRRKKS